MQQVRRLERMRHLLPVWRVVVVWRVVWRVVVVWLVVVWPPVQPRLLPLPDVTG